MHWSSDTYLKMTSTLPSLTKILKCNYYNQVLVREIRLSPE